MRIGRKQGGCVTLSWMESWRGIQRSVDKGDIAAYILNMSPQELSRVCETMPLTGPFAGTQIRWHEYAKDDISVTLELRSGDRLLFNTWEDFDDWYDQLHIYLSIYL